MKKGLLKTYAFRPARVHGKHLHVDFILTINKKHNTKTTVCLFENIL